jgi:nitrite reductase (NAD(P)H)
MVKVKQLRTWEDVVKNCGSGSLVGCEVCKPAVGSILASLYVSLPYRFSSSLRHVLIFFVLPCFRFNEPILNPSHHKLQDTNDKFLANMQRDGTFSVVPRIAAGEITPDGLIAIGEVARRWGMYTKVRRL